VEGREEAVLGIAWVSVTDRADAITLMVALGSDLTDEGSSEDI